MWDLDLESLFEPVPLHVQSTRIKTLADECHLLVLTVIAYLRIAEAGNPEVNCYVNLKNENIVNAPKNAAADGTQLRSFSLV